MNYERRPQRKAKVITILGVLLSVALLVPSFLIVASTIGLSPLRLLLVFTGAALPGVGLGIFAKNLQEVLDTSCDKCGLKEIFFFDKNYSRKSAL